MSSISYQESKKLALLKAGIILCDRCGNKIMSAHDSSGIGGRVSAELSLCAICVAHTGMKP